MFRRTGRGGDDGSGGRCDRQRAIGVRCGDAHPNRRPDVPSRHDVSGGRSAGKRRTVEPVRGSSGRRASDPLVRERGGVACPGPLGRRQGLALRRRPCDRRQSRVRGSNLLDRGAGRDERRRATAPISATVARRLVTRSRTRRGKGFIGPPWSWTGWGLPVATSGMKPVRRSPRTGRHDGGIHATRHPRKACDRPAQATSSRRFPHGSWTWNRDVPGISAGSAHSTSTPAPGVARRVSSSASTESTRSAGCAFVAAWKSSATPTWSSCAPRRNHTPPRAASSGGFGSSSSPSSGRRSAARRPRSRAARRPGRGRDRRCGRSVEMLGAPRDPGPEKRTRFSRWVPCRPPATPSAEPELPSCECWFTLRARGHARRRAARSLVGRRADRYCRVA